MRFSILCSFLLASIAIPASAQFIPFDSDRWGIEGATSVLTQYNGREALYLHGATAWITDDPMENGVIEFDVAFSAQRGFSGAFWRRDNEGDREEFYFRPHQSGKPDANQYNPVLSGVAGWQLYYGPSYAAPIRYRHNEWMHVRIVYYGSTADVFVDSDEPALSISLKSPPVEGSFGIYASSFSPAYFANFRYRRLESSPQMGTPIPEPDAPANAIMEWDISPSFSEDRLKGMTNLPSSLLDTLSWTRVSAESTGIINLARHAPFGSSQNTVIARTVLSADAPAIKSLSFGYSDRAAVFLNAQLLYRGSNNYQSRDYRYLGTIGLFDELPLRLEQGENELVVAVSESFGGWGLIATLE